MAVGSVGTVGHAVGGRLGVGAGGMGCRVVSGQSPWVEQRGRQASVMRIKTRQGKARQGKTREDRGHERAGQASGYREWTQSARLQRAPAGLIQKCRGAIGMSYGSGEQARLCQRRDSESGVGTGKERL